ncbi:MAG: septum formation initiator family protein [bacterium]|nr:MAG: septum formation initiator family protein [bacterium]
MTHRPRRLAAIMLLTLCLFLLYSALGERGFIRLNQMIRQREDLKARVRGLEESNARLAEQISLLRDDPFTIEYFARTQLGLVRPGETVYILGPAAGEQP